MVNICVVGAGIIGVSTAIAIQRSQTVRITLIADKFSPNTTGDGAAGFWGPYLLGDTPPEKVRQWSGATHKLLETLWKSRGAGKYGVTLIPSKRVNTVASGAPEWKDVVYGFRFMTEKELKSVARPGLVEGWDFVTYTCECAKILPELMKEFTSNGGILVQQLIKSWSQLADGYDIIVDCTGIGARDLARDQSVVPKRGQVIRVKAPWVKSVILDDSDDGNYIIPNMDSVILGGTHQEGDWNTNPYPEDTTFIIDGCNNLIPALKDAPVKQEWVGLRPGRPSVRLEKETVIARGRKLTVIHNYGHGGSGVTLFWGCAEEAAQLVSETLNSMSLKAKL